MITCRRHLALAALALLLGSITLLARPAAASPGWEKVLDRPTPNFGAVDFVSDSEGWMPAGAGLLHTTDGGATWQENAKLTVNDVDFFDRDHGWAVGLSGAIYGTSDGGVSWQRQGSSTGVHLSRVEAAGQSEAWVVGQYEGFSDVILPPPVPSVLLHTIDGGRSWQSIDPPANSSYRWISFISEEGWVLLEQCEPDPNYSYCMYEPTPTPVLQHTANGGQTWNLLSAPSGQDFLSNLIFVDASNGWMSGGYCSIDNCYNLGDHSAIFRTTDGGSTWDAVDTTAYGRIVALTMKDALHGWALADNCPASGAHCVYNLLTTEDGATWFQVSQTQRDVSGYGHSLRFHHGVVFRTSFGGVSLRSSDEGRSWESMQTPAVELWDVAAPSAQVAYAGGRSDVLRTNDAGQTWRRVGSAGENLRLLAFSDETHGVAASWDCSYACLGIYHTIDGGVSWQLAHRVARDRSTFPISLQMTPTGAGLLALAGTILTTSDGGASWQESSSLPEAEYISNAGLIDAAHAWAVSNVKQGDPGDAQLHLSNDGGRTWQTAARLESAYKSVSFADAQHGWYIGQQCGDVCATTLYGSQDGGISWSALSELPEDYIVYLTFVDQRNGWAVGITTIKPERTPLSSTARMVDSAGTRSSRLRNRSPGTR